MKRKRTLGQKMRVVAGGTYIVLALYQMLTSFYISQSAVASDLNITMQFSAYAIWLFAAMAVWMFARDKELSVGARRGVMVGSLLVVCFELVTWQMQIQIIKTALYGLLPSLYENTAVQYVFMLVRILLIVLAAFFVSASKPEVNRPEVAELEEAGEDDMPEAIIEETVVILTDEDEDGDA